MGRELEASPTVTHDTIERVLSGAASYDDLSGPAQAIVRTAWNDEVAARTAGLDFEEERQAEALPWSEADADGTVVVRNPDAP